MSERAPQSLHKIDINLLVVLDVLLETRSATTACERLNLTRSAVSHGLRRVRDLLGDELLVRGGEGGSQLTPFAEKLRKPLRRTLVQLESILPWHLQFEPSTAHAHFTVAASDWWTTYSFPRLVRELSSQAPSLHLHIVPLNPSLIAGQFRRGEVDIAIGPFAEDEPELSSLLLGKDRMVGVVRPDHPLAGKRPSTEEWASAQHAVVAPASAVENLEAHSREKSDQEKHFVMTLPYTMSVPALVTETDLVVMLPRVLAKQLVEQGRNVAIVDSPVELPEISARLVWHREAGKDPGQVWLRERIISLLAILAAQWSMRFEPE